MAYSDKPTEHQVNCLTRAYDAILYDLIGRKRDEMDDELTRNAAKLIKTRREISQEIDVAQRKGVIKSRKAREFFEKELKNIGIKIGL